MYKPENSEKTIILRSHIMRDFMDFNLEWWNYFSAAAQFADRNCLCKNLFAF